MDKVGKVMHEFKEGKLHSGSKHGPEVTSREQAIAIALSEQRKADKNYPEHAQKRVHHSPAMFEVDCHKIHTVQKG